MRRSGFVLVGGFSSRMGRDKALLPFRGRPLVDHVARQVLQAAGSVTLVGAPERYAALGYPTIADQTPGQGPLGGVQAALRSTASEWNLIAACDMPRLEAPFLAALLDHAALQACDCVVPLAAPDVPEPLCAAWHRQALAKVEAALENGMRRMSDALQLLDTRYWPAEPAWFANVNTPQEWARHA